MRGSYALAAVATILAMMTDASGKPRTRWRLAGGVALTILLLAGAAWLQLHGIAGTIDLTQVTVEPPTADLGRVQGGAEFERQFTIRNHADRPVRVAKVTTTCSCLKPARSEFTIPPGRADTLTLTYHVVGSPGYKKHTAYLYVPNASGPRASRYLSMSITADVTARGRTPASQSPSTAPSPPLRTP